MTEIGSTTWAIAEGYIPGGGTGPDALQSHETACLLNATDTDASVEVTVYFTDREPVGVASTGPAREDWE